MEHFMDKLWLVCLAVFGLGGWVICDVVKTIAVNWRKARESEHLAALKQTLVERGLSVEEIERVVNAGRDQKKSAEEIASRKDQLKSAPA